MTDINKIYTGHALEVLKTFEDASINMCITSPPYWSLRDYRTTPVNWNDDWCGELGAEPNLENYINHLCDIFDEVKRVLKDDGTCWVNLGDTYGGSCLGLSYGVRTKGKKSFLKTTDYLPRLAHARGIYSKSLLLIPFRFAIEMINRGWTIRNVIIWHKPNGTPESVKDRFTNDFEYLFFFSKSKKYYFEQQFEPYANTTIQRSKRNNKSAKTGNYKGLTIEHLQKMREKILSSEAKGRNKRAVWHISTTGFKGAHFATFPTKLIETPIKSGCPENGIILDPFIGSGTTAVVAKELNRNYIGIELNPEYTKIAEDRINGTT